MGGGYYCYYYLGLLFNLLSFLHFWIRFRCCCGCCCCCKCSSCWSVAVSWLSGSLHWHLSRVNVQFFIFIFFWCWLTFFLPSVSFPLPSVPPSHPPPTPSPFLLVLVSVFLFSPRAYLSIHFQSVVDFWCRLCGSLDVHHIRIRIPRLDSTNLAIACVSVCLFLFFSFLSFFAM